MAGRIDIRRAAGRLIIGGFEGTTLAGETAFDLGSERLGGVVLFRRNIESLDQVADLTASIQAARPPDQPPLMVAIDQEGGPVARLRGLITDLPPMRRLGDVGDPRLAADMGEMLGTELAALGINTDFAPVMDVDTNPDNPVIGSRAFSSDPAVVARLAGAFALGLLSAGVLPCGKHFPGHGDTLIDSHIDLPVVDHDRQRLAAVEWIPFAAAARARLPLLMTGHLLVPALDPHRPATFSPPLLEDTLRRSLGFGGVIISDDLEMGAVATRYSPAEMAELGLRAGLDLFLVCHRRDVQSELFEALVRVAERDSRLGDALAAADHRVTRLRHNHLLDGPAPASQRASVIRTAEHAALVSEIDRRLTARSG